MSMLVAVLLVSVGMVGETVPKYPKISSLLRLQLPCMKYDVIESNLKYAGERLRLSAVTANGDSLVEMWTDSEDEGWTIILHTIVDNEGCVIATGQGVVAESPSATINERVTP